AGTMTGDIALEGILRPSGFLLDGGIIASSTGFTEISLDAAVPAIAATGSCNLAAGLTVITREGPVAAGQSWTVVEAGSFSLGAIALPSLGPGLEWALNNSATSLSLAATAVQVRCRPSVDRLSAAVVDGYVGNPIVLAAAVSGPVSDVRWYKDGLPLTDGGIYSGAETPELSIASNAPVNLARYHLIATGLCGKTASLPIDASVRCGGDFNQDFSVDGDDVIDFFGPWDAGEIAADWNRDGAVDGDDVIGFFGRWDEGC
ncbi:MAG: GC-type dockerin domain-anchored protein, partial [Phycisphaerales bacterium]